MLASNRLAVAVEFVQATRAPVPPGGA
jgi:hypothetical protein